MTLVESADGPIETSLPAEAVADLQVTPKAEPAPAPAEAPKEPETSNPPAAPAPAEVKPDATAPTPPPTVEPEAPKGKAKPIANLLSKLNDERIAREAAEKRASEAEAKLVQPPTPAAPATPAPATPAPSATDQAVEDLVKKHGITDPSLIRDVIEAARAGITPPQNPQLPKEVQEMLAERQQEKAHQAEIAAFDTRVAKLATVFKDEPIGDHKQKLMELAYSTDLAPDGERYADKELSELYFGFIKPTIEPGTVSAEAGRGATGGGTKIVDFQDIFDRDDPKEIEAMSPEQFKAYSVWMKRTQGDVKISNP